MVFTGRVKYRCKYCQEEYFDKKEFARHKRQQHLDEISQLSTSDTSSLPFSEGEGTLPRTKNTKRKYPFAHSPSLFRNSTTPESPTDPSSSESGSVASEEDDTGDLITTVLESDNTPEGTSATSQPSVPQPEPSDPQPLVPTPTENSALVKSVSCGNRNKRMKNMPVKIGKNPNANGDGDESELFMHNPKFAGG